MSEKEKEIIKVFTETFPHLSEVDLEKLICFAEGLAFTAGQMNRRTRTNSGERKE